MKNWHRKILKTNMNAYIAKNNYGTCPESHPGQDLCHILLPPTLDLVLHEQSPERYTTQSRLNAVETVFSYLSYRLSVP